MFYELQNRQELWKATREMDTSIRKGKSLLSSHRDMFLMCEWMNHGKINMNRNLKP